MFLNTTQPSTYSVYNFVCGLNIDQCLEEINHLLNDDYKI